MQRVNWLKHNLRNSDIPYLLILAVIFVGVIVTNFPLNNTWLTGWDNLHPEFNILLNIKRAFEGVWQANEGVGLVGGHGYAATLPHTIAIWLLSFVFPAHMLRAVFTFLMLLIGSLGTYFVTTYLLYSYKNTRASVMIRTAGLLAAAFMMLNIGTIQNFYIQLEAFIIHFAFLPWLILTTWHYLHTPSRKTFIAFLLITIAIIPSGFIPPLFIVQNILIGVSIVLFLVYKRNQKSLRSGLVIVTTILCVNAFWLFPFLYYTITHSQNYLHAYNNLQSTNVFIEKNQKYGDIFNVPLMQSFLFESNDITADGQMVPILKPWIDHMKQPLTMLFGYGIFALSVIGLFLFLTNKKAKAEHKSFSFMYIGIFLLLATNIPPFSWVTELLRKMSPLFEQAFRIAFTKFSIAYAFGMAVFAGIGLFLLLTRVHKNIRVIITIGIFGLLGWYGLPVFQGNFFYTRTKIAIPTAYNELFTYMQSQPAGGRVMNLPQGQNWGWVNHSWGYSGSGFLWYGIEQPILDRSFDVWSPYNENYYWEITQAIYSKNWDQFDALIHKYVITWILIDNSILTYPNGKWLFSTNDVIDHINTMPNAAVARIFSNLTLYKINTTMDTSGVSLYRDLPNVMPIYTWNDLDTASTRETPYISTKQLPVDTFFPFRSLFTKRIITEKEFSIDKNSQGYTLSPKTVPPQGTYTGSRDAFIPMRIDSTLTKTGIDLSFAFLYPEQTQPSTAKQQIQTWHIPLPKTTESMTLAIGKEMIIFYKDAHYVFTPTVLPFFPATNHDVVLTINGKNVASAIQIVPPANTTNFSGALFIPFMQGSLTYDSTVDPTFFQHKAHDCKKLLDTEQKTSDKNGKSLEFISQNNDQCFDIILDKFEQTQGYLVEIQSEYVSGNPLHVAVVNKTVQKTDFEMTLPTTPGKQTSYLIIPPAQRDGLGYGLHFANSALTQKITNNRLFSVKVTPMPYTYATTLALSNQSDGKKPQVVAGTQTSSTMSYKYIAHIQDIGNNSTLTLSQAFDSGWHAYQIHTNPTNNPINQLKTTMQSVFPFLFGNELKNHVLVNNWANGWTINNPTNNPINTNEQMTIVIFFLPQLLEWFGFLLIPIPFLFIIKNNHE